MDEKLKRIIRSEIEAAFHEGYRLGRWYDVNLCKGETHDPESAWQESHAKKRIEATFVSNALAFTCGAPSALSGATPGYAAFWHGI